jgi:hypothetical protein
MVFALSLAIGDPSLAQPDDGENKTDLPFRVGGGRTRGYKRIRVKQFGRWPGQTAKRDDQH